MSHIVRPSISTSRTRSFPNVSLKTTTLYFDNDNHAVLQPFVVGPWSCIGRNLAYVEMRYILTMVLFNL